MKTMYFCRTKFDLYREIIGLQKNNPIISRYYPVKKGFSKNENLQTIFNKYNMAKRKLQRFAEMKTFHHVFEPSFDEIFKKDFHLKNNWKQGFFKNDNPIVLELGCGKGEYAVNLAKLFPNKNFIGIDIKGARMWRGAKTAVEENIANVAFIRTKIEFVTSFFGANEVDEIWLTFPDPQIKKLKKRLSSARFLNMYTQFLSPDGIVHLKTDSELLYHFTLDIIQKNNLSLVQSTDDLYNSSLTDKVLSVKTFYEQHYLARGIKMNYAKFQIPGTAEIENPLENEELQAKEIRERQLTRTNQINRMKNVI